MCLIKLWVVSFPECFYLFIFKKCYVFFDCGACGILVPWPGIELAPNAVEALSIVFNKALLFFKCIYLFQLEDNWFIILWWLGPYISMNQPQVYMWSLPLESLPHSTHPGCHRAPVLGDDSYIKLPLAICFTCNNAHASGLFSQIIPPFPSPNESKSPFFTSVSPLLPFR